MIHMPEYSLYEAEDLFLKPIGIPDDFGFPVREDLIPKLETQISRIGKKLIREQWDELLLKGGYAAAQMIPEISRVYIQLNADRFIKKEAAGGSDLSAAVSFCGYEVGIF